MSSLLQQPQFTRLGIDQNSVLLPYKGRTVLSSVMADETLISASSHRLGKPLPYQQSDYIIAHLLTINFYFIIQSFFNVPAFWINK